MKPRPLRVTCHGFGSSHALCPACAMVRTNTASHGLIVNFHMEVAMFEPSVVSVHIPPTLRVYVDGHEEVMVSGETVGELLEAIGHEYPSFNSRVMSADGVLAPGMRLYLGGQSITDLKGLETPVALEEVLSIMPTASI